MRPMISNWSWPPQRILLLSAAVVFVLILTAYSSYSPTVGAYTSKWSSGKHKIHSDAAQKSRIAQLEAIAKWKKPADVKVIGLVFYGRRRFVQILDCYLKRNLVENGGILDQIVFAAKTEDKDDLAYLEELLRTNPSYSAEYHHEKGINFSQMYGACAKGTICVKIDDDVLFIEDSTIRSLVKKKIEHPEYFTVSANLVNNFATAWLHYHMGAVRPYLPEISPPSGPLQDWRPSKLPQWEGPSDFDFKNYNSVKGHRWLPVPDTNPHARQTPIDKSEYTLKPNGWFSWKLAAQEHYSFLEHLEKDELWRYGFDTWDYSYDRVGVNMIALSGDDLAEMGPMPGADEQAITMDYSKKIGKRVVIDGHGVAVHHGYASMAVQGGGKDWRIEGTDLLDRYRLYAEEFICPK